ncbi:helix-turn-helix domain-containing protein [Spirosoma panaciterrae]|uniref:helix-turn-helix domain-containing protein n=1 Tax=Spirosoma panaciterrae TaxID=496058 RepID=UPI000594AE59|nr:helix-turn-helix transcriptional regulator [Spirosoma panaciterrae]
MDKSSFLKGLGSNIVKLRSEKNWSQSDLARACFKDRQSIERLEKGKINPSIYYLKEIADALGVELSHMLMF